MKRKYTINSSQRNIQISKFAYILYSFNSYLSGIGFGSVVFSYSIMLLVPFTINGNKQSFSLLYLCLLLFMYPIINQAIPIFFIYFFVYTFRNTPISKFALLNLKLYICFLILQLIFLKLGIVHNQAYDLIKGSSNTFGFVNANVFAEFIMGINISIYIIGCRKKFWSSLTLILLINQWMFQQTASRTTWIGTIIMLVVGICYKMNILRNWTRYILAFLPILLTFGCFYFVKNAYNYPELNLLLSGRLDILNDSYRKITFNTIISGFSPDDALDCAYIGIVANGGGLWLIFFLISTSYCIFSKFKQIKQYIPVIILMIIGGLTENTFCRFSPPSILFWTIILNNHTLSTLTNYSDTKTLIKHM